MTTAAAVAPRWLRPRRGSAVADRRTHGERPRTPGRRAARPGKARAVQAAEADSADSNRSAGIGAPSFGRPARERRPTDRGGVRHDAIRHAAPLERRDRLGGAGDRLAGQDDDAVEVEQQRTDTGQRRVAGRPVGWRTSPDGRLPDVDMRGGTDGTARGQEGAHLRGRQRPLDRVGHRAGAARRGRGGRLLVDREPHREARPAARRVDRLDVRGAVRRPERRRHRARLRALGRDARSPRHPRPRPCVRQARGPDGRLRRHVARRVRAGHGRVRVLARRADPRGDGRTWVAARPSSR